MTPDGGDWATLGAALTVAAIVGRLVVLPCFRAYRWAQQRLAVLDDVYALVAEARDAATKAHTAAREVLGLAFTLAMDVEHLQATHDAHVTAIAQLRAYAVAHDRVHADKTA